MPLLWFCLCAYLLFAAVALVQAEIGLRPGAAPSTGQVLWAILAFALSQPVRSLFGWLRERTEERA